MKQSVCEIVREVEDNYINGTSQLGEYVEWDMHDTIETIDAYLNSKHITGDKDSKNREKPFFNIVTSSVNIWYRATDIDRKNIRILPNNSSNTLLAFIATTLLQEWMKKSRFGVFLNDWGRSLSRYGSSVVKFVEKDGELIATVVPWNRIICDPIDFDAAPRIEKLYMTPAQLRSNPMYDQEVVDSLLDSASTRETLDGQQQDNASHFIEVYEVHGMLPEYLLAEDPDQEEDNDQLRQQMHVVSFTGSGDDVKDFTLFRGKEKQDPYMLTHLIKEDGRTLSIGAVEYLFDAQWMKNHTMKNMKDTLDLASKLIFQTSDTTFVGRNVLSAIETGDIMVHQQNQPLTQINNSKADITSFQNFGREWENLSQTLTSTPDAMRGDTLPSGTPYSLGAYLGAQANSLFEIMTENKGLHIEDMMRQFIIPYLKTKMDNANEVRAILEENDIDNIDTAYVKTKAIKHVNKQVVKAVLNRQYPSAGDQREMLDTTTSKMNEQLSGIMGNQRFFKPSDIKDKTWKEALKDLEWELTVEVTNENTDKRAVLQTLSSLLQTVASNPAVLQDPNAKMLFSQILTETGKISPLQIAKSTAPAQGGGSTKAIEGVTSTPPAGSDLTDKQ